MASEAGYLVEADAFERMQRVGKALVNSGYFNDSLTGNDTNAIAQATVKVLAGHELGIAPVAAMMGVHLIKGRVGLSAHLQLACAKKAGYSYTVNESGEGQQRRCSMEWYDANGRALGSSSFSLEDAERAGLTNGENWKKYPGDMLFARAASQGVRRFCAEATAGMVVHTPEELGAPVDDAGEVINVAVEQGSREKVQEIKATKLKGRIAELEAAGKDVPDDMRAKLAEYETPPPVKPKKAKPEPEPLELVASDAIRRQNLIPALDEHGDPLPMRGAWLKKYVQDDERLLKISKLWSASKEGDMFAGKLEHWLEKHYVCTAESLAKLLDDAEASGVK